MWDSISAEQVSHQHLTTFGHTCTAAEYVAAAWYSSLDAVLHNKYDMGLEYLGSSAATQHMVNQISMASQIHKSNVGL